MPVDQAVLTKRSVATSRTEKPSLIPLFLSLGNPCKPYLKRFHTFWQKTIRPKDIWLTKVSKEECLPINYCVYNNCCYNKQTLFSANICLPNYRVLAMLIKDCFGQMPTEQVLFDQEMCSHLKKRKGMEASLKRKTEYN